MPYTPVPVACVHAAGPPQQGQQAQSTYSTPTRADWEHHRQLIKQLYVDENKKLKDVIEIMEQHGFKATPKMYKDRIKKWGLDKNNKEHEMLAIVRKKTERDAIGKQTKFRLRGRIVTMDQVLHYLNRKEKFKNRGSPFPSTPSDLSCRTPSPALVLQPCNEVNSIVPMNYWSSQVRLDPLMSLEQEDNDTEMEVVRQTPASLSSFMIEDDIVQQTPNDICCLISDAHPVDRPISPPKTLLVPERLLLTVKSYIQGSFANGYWIEDENGNWKLAHATLTSTNISNYQADFYTYFRTAIDLEQGGALVEFRRVLSKAFNTVSTLLSTEHPRTLDRFFDAFLMLIKYGYMEIVDLLRRYICEMATTILSQEHPLRHVCELITVLDKGTFEQAIVQTWECGVDSFQRDLGSFNRTSLQIQVSFVNRVYKGKDSKKEEKVLRTLLAQCEEVSNISVEQPMWIMINLGRCLLEQNQDLEAEEMGLRVLLRAEDAEVVEVQIQALDLIAWCQYEQNKRDSAEMNMRRAIEMATEEWGKADSWVINFMVTLESWLRRWGREEDADALHAEWEDLGPDEI
ncbi:hypothetical protein EG329_009032 [Mollisiaceae sp. DMI_Dod_QoI]|nr:hypothetical protein EG329_009032 [Helotiales sp. DMI_Dod_QoI]